MIFQRTVIDSLYTQGYVDFRMAVYLVHMVSAFAAGPFR